MAQRNASSTITLLLGKHEKKTPLANPLCYEILIYFAYFHSPTRILKIYIFLGFWKKFLSEHECKKANQFQNSWGFSSTVRDIFSLTCYLKIKIFIKCFLSFFFGWCFAQQLKRHSKIMIPFHWKLFQYLGKGFNSTSCRIHCRFVFEQEYIPFSQVY